MLCSVHEVVCQTDSVAMSCVQSNDIKEQSWINATLLWGADTMGISDDSIYNLNMTNGPPSRNSFQARYSCLT